MSAAPLLARARQAAEALMVDACAIARVTGEVTDPDSGEVTQTTEAVYAGRCRVQQAGAQAAAEDTGEDYRLVLRLEVQLPMTVTGLQVGDRVTVTASAHDADLVDRTFRIRDLAHKTHATARRVQVEEVTS